MAGFTADSKKKILEKLFDTILAKKTKQLQVESQKMVKDVIMELDVYDTGLTHDKTYTEVKANKSEGKFTISFISPKTIIRNKVWYPIYPYYGLGTNRKYGPRPWLEIAAKRFYYTKKFS